MTRPCALALLMGCTQPIGAPLGLRVPLAEGWVAVAAPSGGLWVGPRAAPVLLLEPQGGIELPSPEALRSAVAREVAAAGLSTDITDDFVAVRYRLSTERSAFVGARRVESRGETKVVFCSSTAAASPHDVDLAISSCRRLTFQSP